MCDVPRGPVNPPSKTYTHYYISRTGINTVDYTLNCVVVCVSVTMNGYQILLDELENDRLGVTLIPSRIKDCADRGGMIRAVESQNAPWYRQFCAMYLSGRTRKNSHIDTRIRRKNIVRILTRLVNGLPSRSAYVEDLTRFAKEAEDFVPF